MKIYLAGPDVFLPNATTIGEAKKRICVRHGALGLFPLDKDVPPFEPRRDWAFAIFTANRGLMDEADAVIVNMTPFRGPSMDVGTAFEMGYMCALGKLVLGYSNLGGTYIERLRRGGIAHAETARDMRGLTIEDFGLPDNLMMVGAARASGFEVFVNPEGGVNDPDLYTDLSLFEDCVRHMVRGRSAGVGDRA